jgi:large subunit ribosomal protein L9
MKVLLIKDVYKLGHAGDVKKVADGYGRNFLLAKEMAVLATPGALKQVDTLRTRANAARLALNNEMGAVAEKLNGFVLTFSSKAGETGKLYGSITNQMIVDAVNEKLGLQIDRHHIDIQPIRTLGEHKATVRLTVDLNPEIKIIVHREGEVVSSSNIEKTHEVVEETPAPAPAAE